ncbi:MAG TPA: helix-turn-helix domain-containing protein [Candidatus Limnocylindrales bacterium]|nr:helix-turn-helix domain-containing protein [Candidatus Limnocylindrales bacterium]
MASLHELHRTLFPTARPVGATRLSAEQGARQVGWVRVLPGGGLPVEALEPGDLIIVPETVEAGPDVAAALVRAGVAAALVAGGEAGGASTLAAAGLTTLTIGRTDPVALERSIIGFLVNRRAELDRRAAELEAQLARLALQGRGLDVQAATIAAFLGRAVVIEGRKGDPLAIHAPSDVPTAAAAVAGYLARPAGPVALRVGIAGPAGDPGPGGRLVLLGDEPPDELERLAAERVAGLLGVELARDAAIRQQRDERRPSDPLPEDGPPWVVLLASQGAAPGVDGPVDLAAREAIRHDVRMLFGGGQLVLRGTAESLELRMVAAAPSDDPEALAVASRLAEFLGRTVALSRPFDEPGGRPVAEAAARVTLEAATQLRPPPVVARADRLPAYQLLGNLRNLPDGARQAAELLAPILVGRADVQRERLDTLRAVLGSASLAEAATMLGVHRNTIAYRVTRLEAVTGWDLSDPDLRLALALASRLVHSAQV